MQGTQAQARKRERKRLKREEKRQSLQSGAAHPCGFFARPDTLPVRVERSLWPPDMSVTFAQFLEPLLDRLPPGCHPRKLNQAVWIASAVWNAMVEQGRDPDKATAFVVRKLEETSHKPVSKRLRQRIEMLAERKWGWFTIDDRRVTDVEVHREGADVRVVARAMTPPTNTVVRGEDSPGRNV